MRLCLVKPERLWNLFFFCFFLFFFACRGAHELAAEKKGGIESYSAACLVVRVIAARQRQETNPKGKINSLHDAASRF
jgi:hypothetical protein